MRNADTAFERFASAVKLSYHVDRFTSQPISLLRHMVRRCTRFGVM
jgi:hypothetical protein